MVDVVGWIDSGGDTAFGYRCAGNVAKCDFSVLLKTVSQRSFLPAIGRNLPAVFDTLVLDEVAVAIKVVLS